MFGTFLLLYKKLLDAAYGCDEYSSRYLEKRMLGVVRVIGNVSEQMHKSISNYKHLARILIKRRKPRIVRGIEGVEIPHRFKERFRRLFIVKPELFKFTRTYR